MFIAAVTITLRAEWVSSLKEKRMVVKSLLARLRGKLNVSAAEVGAQDDHKTIVIGAAAISNDRAHAEEIANRALAFVTSATDAVVTDSEIEIF